MQREEKLRFKEGLESLTRRLDVDASLRRRARGLDLRMLLVASGRGSILVIRDGAIVSVEDDLGPMHEWDISLSMAEADWLAFWQPEPAPGWHDIFALTRSGRLTIGGDHLQLMRYLQVVKDLLALPQRVTGGAA